MITRRLIVPFYQRDGFARHLETLRFISGLRKYAAALVTISDEEEQIRIKGRGIKK